MFPFTSLCVFHHTSLNQSVSGTAVLVFSNTFWWQILCSFNAQKSLLWDIYVVWLCVYSNTDGPKPKRRKNQKLVYMQCCWHKTKERKNLENEGGAYLPPTCPSLIVTANLVHLIREEKTCPSALSSLAPSPSPHKRQTVEDTLYSTEL